MYVGSTMAGVDRLGTVRKDRRDRCWRSQRLQLRISQFCGGDQVVLPLREFLVEQAGVVFDDTVEQSVELLGVDAVSTLDFSVEAGGGRPDVDMTDALIKHVPVEAGLKFLSVWIFSTWKGSRDTT